MHFSIHIGCGAHSTSYAIGIRGSFPQVSIAWGYRKPHIQPIQRVNTLDHVVRLNIFYKFSSYLTGNRLNLRDNNTNCLTFCMEVIGVNSENHTKPINIFYGEIYSSYTFTIGLVNRLNYCWASPAQSFMTSVSSRSMTKILFSARHVRVSKWGLLCDKEGGSVFVLSRVSVNSDSGWIGE
jgi:hypothetical protein